LPAGLHRRDRRRGMQGQIARLVAATAAIAHIGRARGPGGRGGDYSPARKVRAPRNLRCRVTPGGSLVASAKAAQGKCHRKNTAGLRPGKVERVRQERTAVLATEPAW